MEERSWKDGVEKFPDKGRLVLTDDGDGEVSFQCFGSFENRGFCIAALEVVKQKIVLSLVGAFGE